MPVEEYCTNSRPTASLFWLSVDTAGSEYRSRNREDLLSLVRDTRAAIRMAVTTGPLFTVSTVRTHSQTLNTRSHTRKRLTQLCKVQQARFCEGKSSVLPQGPGGARKGRNGIVEASITLRG